MYDNSVLMVWSDNGANPDGGGSNEPLRGKKTQLFEGGVKTPAFIHTPLLPSTSKVATHLPW
jgi:arylsulfatase A-like enzyme